MFLKKDVNITESVKPEIEEGRGLLKSESDEHSSSYRNNDYIIIFPNK